jgi:hypothetical protein
VNHLTARFRGLFVALVALALSSGAAFAWGGPPEAANDGLATAAAAAGQTVPARADEAPAGAEDEDADTDEAEAPETEDPADDSASGDTHGDLVSQAAEMDTPAAFTDAGFNHGAFVSCVARMNHGHEDPDAAPSEPVDLTTLTPEACGLTTEAAAATKAPKANGKAKDHSTHGKSAQAKGHNH